ncbi:host cell division inhibitor Icd-like protein [Rouxiella chamberiensis]|nr:host cell division inhibitor Icd-like protein [Rouxiella chamberiensis]
MITKSNYSALGSTPVKAQSLTLKQTCASGSVNKAVADSNTSVFLFASVKRSDPKAQPAMIRIVACSEHEARRELVRDYILSLAARLPIKGFAYVAN